MSGIGKQIYIGTEKNSTSIGVINFNCPEEAREKFRRTQLYQGNGSLVVQFFAPYGFDGMYITSPSEMKRHHFKINGKDFTNLDRKESVIESPAAKGLYYSNNDQTECKKEIETYLNGTYGLRMLPAKFIGKDGETFALNPDLESDSSKRKTIINGVRISDLAYLEGLLSIGELKALLSNGNVEQIRRVLQLYDAKFEEIDIKDIADMYGEHGAKEIVEQSIKLKQKRLAKLYETIKR